MKPMNWAKLAQLIDEGRGQGHLEAYASLLRITRRNFPRYSNQVVAVLPGFRRRFDFLSRAEYRIALFCIWLGVIDLREQFPLWPFPHQHPLNDWPLASVPARYAPALQDIAREAGIDHGQFPGSVVPYVATTDILLTMGDRQAPSLVAIACKAASRLRRVESSQRMMERLELERRYFEAVGARFVIADGGDINTTLLANLQTVAPDHSSVARLAAFTEREAAQEAMQRRLEQESIRDAVWATMRDLRVAANLAWDVFHALAWSAKIDVDLTQPLHVTLPLRGGGSQRRVTLRRTWLGEVRHG